MIKVTPIAAGATACISPATESTCGMVYLATADALALVSLDGTTDVTNNAGVAPGAPLASGAILRLERTPGDADAFRQAWYAHNPGAAEIVVVTQRW